VIIRLNDGGISEILGKKTCKLVHCVIEKGFPFEAEGGEAVLAGVFRILFGVAQPREHRDRNDDEVFDETHVGDQRGFGVELIPSLARSLRSAGTTN